MSPFRCVVAGVVCLGFAGSSPAGDGRAIGYLETFTLAADRETALEKLIPGSTDYYYYHALHYQNTGQLDKVDELLKIWGERHSGDHRRAVIENRQILLSYDAAPDAALERLRKRLNLDYRHQREHAAGTVDRPTSIDQNAITRDRFMAVARTSQRNSVEQFEPTAYDWLVTCELTNLERRDLLSRLDHPDYPDLPAMIAADLNYERSRGFGDHKVDRLLTLGQLGELRELKPDLIHNATFIATWLASLRPGPDVDVERNLSSSKF